jgi:hypothetical protein
MLYDAKNVYVTTFYADYYMNEISEKAYAQFKEQGEVILVFDSGFPTSESDKEKKIAEYDKIKNNDALKEQLQNLSSELLTTESFIGYYEELFGCKAEYCTSESVHNLRVSAYRFSVN